MQCRWSSILGGMILLACCVDDVLLLLLLDNGIKNNSNL